MRRAALLLALLSTTAIGGDEEIDELILRLGHGVEAVREDAALKLKEMGPAAAPAIPALAKAMRDDVLWADDALVAIGERAVPVLVQILKISDRRVDAIRALGKIGRSEPLAEAAISDYLGDPDPKVRLAALVALGRIGTGGGDELKTSLLDLSPEVRATAASSLFAIGAGSETALEVAIEAFLLDGSTRTREALVEIGYPCVGPLVRKYPHLREPEKEKALRLFEELEANAKPATPLLIEIIATDPTAGTSLRHAAARALAAIKLDDPAAIAALKIRLIDPACCEGVLEALATLGEPAVPTIAGVLTLGIDDAQRAAVRILYELGPEASEAQKALRARLDDSRDRIAVYAAFALLRIDPIDEAALAALKRTMSEGDAVWGRVVTRGFANAGPKAVAALTRWLSDDNERLRTMAAVTFAIPPREEPFPEAALVRALGDAHWRVRQWAARALAGSEATAALRRSLTDPERAVRIAAALAWANPEPVAAKALLEALEFGDEDERIAAMHALGKLGEAKAIPHLIRFLASDDTYLALETREALVSLGAPAIPALIEEGEYDTLALIGDAIIPPLLRVVRDEDAVRRGWAVSLLGAFRHRPELVIPILVSALDDESESVRLQAMRLLGEFGPKVKEQALAKLLATPDSSRDRLEAIWAISHDESLVLPALRKQLGSKDLLDRKHASWSLAEMAPHSTEARALLESALDDEDEIVRLQAAGFLAEGNRPSARVTGILIGGLIYKDQRAESGFALWNTGALASAVSHENRRVRQGAAAFMKTFGIPGPAEAEALLRALTTRDPEMRALAASVFEHESSYAEQAEPVLATVLSDKRISVAIAAAKALAANGIRRADSLPRVYAAMGRKGMTIELAEALGSLGAEVVPDLMRYLREGSVRERAFAAIALGHVGRAASPALDLLMELSEKGDERVRLAAGIAVRDILAEIPPQAIGIGGRSEK